jgi:hypothetical protein
MAPLHPTSVSALSDNLLNDLRKQHRQDITALQAEEDAPELEALFRLLLVLRFNAHYRWA